MEGSRHSFLTPDLMVLEEQGGAANGSLLENRGPSEWQLYCRKEGVGAVGLGIPRGLDSIAWFRGCGCVSTWAQGGWDFPRHNALSPGMQTLGPASQGSIDSTVSSRGTVTLGKFKMLH